MVCPKSLKIEIIFQETKYLLGDQFLSTLIPILGQMERFQAPFTTVVRN